MWKCSSCKWKNSLNYIICERCFQAKPGCEFNPSNALILRSTIVQNDEYQIQQIISSCKKFKTHFVDDRFVPSDQSLGSNSFNTVSRWLRIADITPSSSEDCYLPWTVISSPSPSDIEQGALGNCWLLAALALITERPRILQHILLTQAVNDEGIYLLRLCYNGLWKTVIVDDCFPCTYQKQLVFSKAKRRQLYVPLIEKACAKLYGSYTSLISGTMLESLQILTGAPCDHIDLRSTNSRDDTDIIWAKLLSACTSNLLIGASTGRTDITENEYSNVHIHSNHAFSILAAHTLPEDSSRFVLVRDPHSHSNYTEKSITSTILKELRKINHTPRSSGAFWISWPIFLRYFASITISTYNENHFDLRYQGKFTRSSTDYLPTYYFHVPETSLISISLVYHRHHRKIRPHHIQSFVLCDINEELPLNNIGQHENILISRQGGFTYWTGSLRPGNYVLIPFSISFWGKDHIDTDYTIVIHSSISLNITNVLKPSTLLADCLISAVTKKYHVITKGKYMTYYSTPNKVQSMFVIIENWSTSHYLNIDITLSHLLNIQHSRQSATTHDCIPPYHRQLIFITEWTNENSSVNMPASTFTYEHTKQITESMPAIVTDLDDIHTPRLF